MLPGASFQAVLLIDLPLLTVAAGGHFCERPVAGARIDPPSGGGGAAAAMLDTGT
jgi:hypothetical protein